MLLFTLGAAVADTPANCLYEDIQGTWNFFETERSGDNTLGCQTLGPVAHTNTVTLHFPNTAVDELGNKGTWTMIWNQGFEVMKCIYVHTYIYMIYFLIHYIVILTKFGQFGIMISKISLHTF